MHPSAEAPTGEGSQEAFTAECGASAAKSQVHRLDPLPAPAPGLVAWRRREASGWLSHELASREAEHGEHTDEVWRSSDERLHREDGLWEVEEEEGRVDEAAGRVEVERARPPHGSRASYGNSGRDAQEPGLVFLGIVDELDELLRRLGNNSE